MEAENDFAQGGGRGRFPSAASGGGGLRLRARVATAAGTAAPRGGEEPEWDDTHPVTAAGVAAIVRSVLERSDIYVLEADITGAQETVRSVIAETCF